MPEAANNRPQFRNIHITQIIRYRLPLAGVVSILHRISGMLMFLLLPFILYLLDNSLASENAFFEIKQFSSHLLVKIIILGLVWAYFHHLLAGIRHLLMDLHMGLDKKVAAKSAAGVLWISIPCAVLVALKLFGVF